MTLVKTRIEGIDPVAMAHEGSDVLSAAWHPPCLAYSPAYIQFQCGFPTNRAPAAVAAWQGDTMVAFVAAACRRTNVGDMYLSSFLALRPGTVSSVAIAVIRTQIRLTLRERCPTLVFAQSGSVGEALLGAIDAMGLRRIALGEHRVHSAFPPQAPAGFDVEELPPEAWAREMHQMRDDTLLAPSFERETLAHFLRGPGGRRLLCVRHRGHIVAAAMSAMTEMRTSTAAARIPTLHYIRLKQQEPEPLTALLAAAHDPQSPVVTVPNTCTISPAVAKAAKLRATGAAFSAFLCPNNCTVPDIRGTECEIV
jgi:hypothetical protein